MTTAPVIACEKCHTADAMRPVEARAYPRAVVVLGYVFSVPATLFIVLVLIGLFMGIITGVADAPMAGVSAALMVPALVPLAIGMFLSRKRKLWQCRVCAYIYERG